MRSSYRIVNSKGDELDDKDKSNDNEDEENLSGDGEYEIGGDITSSSYVNSDNIETKIHNRFIKPAVKAGDGFYEKRIAKVIQIVDLDGAYLFEDSIVPFSSEHVGREKLFYNENDGVIETNNYEDIFKRNERKRANLEHLLSLTKKGIRIKSRTVPYEIYFFSSNLDHYINNNANLESSKKYYADLFNRRYGLDPDMFCEYFFDDPGSIGHMGYYESWEEVKKDSNSVRRFTNIDCLIRKLLYEAK